MRCKLCRGRTHIVFGQGNPAARLMFVGEGPGQEEDLAGEPFVGAAGQLLTQIIEAIRLRREDVYIANVVKCRPPGNRAAGGGRDRELLALPAAPDRRDPTPVHLHPGRVRGADPAAHPRADLAPARPLPRGRGDGVLPTFHPAYLLRNPEHKREVWEDMKLLMNEYPYGG